jgi:hypothetical protein
MPRTPPNPELEIRRYEIGDEALERERGYLDDQYLNSNAVLHREKVVFMLIPKAAATSIQRAANLRRNNVEWRSKQYVLNECVDYYKISFVRNPLERLISCWRGMVYTKLHRTFHLFGIAPQTPFEDFVRIVHATPDWQADKHFRGQSASLIDAGRLIPDFLGNVEQIDEEWKMVQGLMRCVRRPADDLEHHNVSTGPKPEYSEETLQLAKERYADDLSHFYGCRR